MAVTKHIILKCIHLVQFQPNKPLYTHNFNLHQQDKNIPPNRNFLQLVQKLMIACSFPMGLEKEWNFSIALKSQEWHNIQYSLVL